MQSAEALKSRIEVTQDLESVVRTMKALSAAAIRQYEKAVSALAEYYRTVELGLYVVLKNQHAPTPPTAEASGGGVGAIVFGSDQGLCGRFNEVIAEYAIGALRDVDVHSRDLRILAVGGRVGARLEEQGYPVEECVLVPGSAKGITFSVEEMLLKIDEWRSRHNVERVLVFYNAPLPGGLHRPRRLHLLPVDLGRFHRPDLEHWSSSSLPTYTMDRGDLISALLRQYFFISLFRACAGSLASEHASRQHAMQRAVKNIDEHLQELNLLYQRERQNSITEELLDIVNGFEASVPGKGTLPGHAATS